LRRGRGAGGELRVQALQNARRERLHGEPARRPSEARESTSSARGDAGGARGEHQYRAFRGSRGRVVCVLRRVV